MSVKEENHFISEPVKYTDDPNYSWFICQCPVDISYGIRIPREGRSRWVGVTCKRCGFTGSTFIRGKEN